jgi:hypothetical protein
VLLLSDNDALLLAAHWDLLDFVPAIAGCGWDEVAVLPQFPPRVARAEARLFGHPDVAARLQACLARCQPLPEPDVDALALLQAVPKIDAGELLLIGALIATPGSQILTGDKNALRALAPLLAQSPIAAAGRRIFCVSQLLWCALEALGADELVRRVRVWPDRDAMTRAIIGRTGDKTAAQLQEGLKSYLSALEAEAPGLLAAGWGC